MIFPLLSVLTNSLEDGCGLWYNAALAKENSAGVIVKLERIKSHEMCSLR
jgi:hypothetical protein